jgi:CRP-like cAMP-binding protein
MQVAMLTGLMDDPLQQHLSLAEVLKMQVEQPLLEALMAAGAAAGDTVARLESYMYLVHYRKGTVLFDIGDPSDTLFIVLSGGVASIFDLTKFTCAPYACMHV